MSRAGLTDPEEGGRQVAVSLPTGLAGDEAVATGQALLAHPGLGVREPPWGQKCLGGSCRLWSQGASQEGGPVSTGALNSISASHAGESPSQDTAASEQKPCLSKEFLFIFII